MSLKLRVILLIENLQPSDKIFGAFRIWKSRLERRKCAAWNAQRVYDATRIKYRYFPDLFIIRVLILREITVLMNLWIGSM